MVNKSTDMWNPVVRDKYIPADLETSYLHLRTNSTAGSGDYTVIYCYNEEGRLAGGIGILFTSPIRFTLQHCQQYYTTFPTSLPTEQDKHWVIEKRGYSTVIYCHGKQVLDITASSETCDDPKYADTWATVWGREVSSITFSSQYDTATISYYIG